MLKHAHFTIMYDMKCKSITVVVHFDGNLKINPNNIKASLL